ncbi:hypothetical protein XENOCAPTIV_014864, partial [Xenoophorus captivus]
VFCFESSGGSVKFSLICAACIQTASLAALLWLSLNIDAACSFPAEGNSFWFPLPFVFYLSR